MPPNGTRPVAVTSDKPALLQQPYTIGGYRNALGRFTGAYQPPAHLRVIDRRIHAFRCVAQVQRGSINVPGLCPALGQFVDSGDDFENQGRNAIAYFPWHSSARRLRRPSPKLWTLRSTAANGETSPEASRRFDSCELWPRATNLVGRQRGACRVSRGSKTQATSNPTGSLLDRCA